jgi:hypothetical protein
MPLAFIDAILHRTAFLLRTWPQLGQVIPQDSGETLNFYSQINYVINSPIFPWTFFIRLGLRYFNLYFKHPSATI